MAHHAYFIAGEAEQGIASALTFVELELALAAAGNPDVLVLRHGLLSVEDARNLRALADLAPTAGDKKVLIVSASRLFHEAQNALLKLFEEPPAGTHLILVIPAEGMLLPTLRSRLMPLVPTSAPSSVSQEAQEFLEAGKGEREKLVARIIERSKSDKDTEKQAARLAAIQLAEGLTYISHERWLSENDPATKKNLQAFMRDLDRFMPILHERSAPLKLIFEHMLLTVPTKF